MTEMNVLSMETNSPEETLEFGRKFGTQAKPGQVYTLVGDLGVGTFTIVQEYEEGRLPFYHFDVYRIGDIEEMDEIGYEDYISGEGVSLIEWSNLIEEILPEERTEILIEKDLEKGFDYRKITVKTPKKG